MRGCHNYGGVRAPGRPAQRRDSRRAAGAIRSVNVQEARLPLLSALRGSTATGTRHPLDSPAARGGPGDSAESVRWGPRIRRGSFHENKILRNGTLG